MELHDPKLEQIDATLLGLLQHTGKIDEFLKIVFGFLYRRTDFYVVTQPGERFGFPEGVAERIAATAFKQYQTIATEKQKSKRREIERQIKKDDIVKPVSDNGAVVEQRSAALDESSEKTAESTSPSQAPQDAPTADESESQGDMDSDSAASEAAAVPKSRQAVESGRTQANDVYNGADCGAYSWSQTILETDLRVKVPSTCRSAQLLKVQLKKKFISVQIKEEGEFRDLVSGTLIYEISTDESMWTLVPGEYVHFHLSKNPERWWDGVFENKEKINLDKIEAVRPMDDLDDDAKMCIAGLMEDDDRRKRGLPSREDEKMYEILRKGWNAPGSPYAGQPHPNDALRNRSKMPILDPSEYNHK